MFVHDVLKLIYQPFKAFKEIVSNPKYHGPILIMILFIAASLSFVYVAVSKTNIEMSIPEGPELDEWTESELLWESNGNKAASDDHIEGVYYGNRSIEFSIVNGTSLWMQLDIERHINCSDYQKISFRLKGTWEESAELESSHVSLFSSEVDYFQKSIRGGSAFENASTWNNFTIPTGSLSTGWMNSTDEADWSNVTKIGFEFTWPQNVTAIVRVEGLFFHGPYKSELGNVAAYLSNFLVYAAMQFTLKWIALGGLLFLLSRMFGVKANGKTLLVVAGFTLITMFFQMAVNTASYAALPPLYYSLEYLGGVAGEREIALQAISEATWLTSTIDRYVQIALNVWAVALCTIGLRTATELTWQKSFLISVVAYIASLMIEGLVLGY